MCLELLSAHLICLDLTSLETTQREGKVHLAGHSCSLDGEKNPKTKPPKPQTCFAPPSSHTETK